MLYSPIARFLLLPFAASFFRRWRARAFFHSVPAPRSPARLPLPRQFASFCSPIPPLHWSFPSIPYPSFALSLPLAFSFFFFIRLYPLAFLAYICTRAHAVYTRDSFAHLSFCRARFFFVAARSRVEPRVDFYPLYSGYICIYVYSCWLDSLFRPVTLFARAQCPFCRCATPPLVGDIYT